MLKDELDNLLATRQPFSIEVDGTVQCEYHKDLEDIKASMRSLHAPEGDSYAEYKQGPARARLTHSLKNPVEWSFRIKMVTFFVLRMCCVISSIFFSPQATLWIAALQFLVLPYSFFVAIVEFFVLFPALFLGHYIVHVPLMHACEVFLSHTSDYVIHADHQSMVGYGGNQTLVGQTSLNTSTLNYYWMLALTSRVVIDETFILAFLVIDQLLCAWCTFHRTPLGASKQLGWKRALQSFTFGFLNCKTYFLILLFNLRGLQIALLPWVIDAITHLSIIVGRRFARYCMHWAALFYHQHCIAHIPFVYQDAHKFHHYLHDTTAFDAHLYGSGAPEEFFCLFFGELLPSLVWGYAPPSLSFWVLYVSWTNKLAHSRKSQDKDGWNFHADHHLYHSKNYGGFYAHLDMYMSTSTNNNMYYCPGYKIIKETPNGRKQVSADSGPARVKFLFIPQ